jgi:hypothetical protein
MAGPDVGTRPRKKRTLTRKKGEPRSRGGGISGKPKTGGGVEWTRKKVVKGAKRSVKAAKAVAADPKGEWKETKKVARNFMKKKPITHMAKKVKGWFS